ncbi:hypothetical protein [Natrialba sp. INN-245]|uniref:hypothetical protein n=1 Tax=Natrialba sp. INN-245 TaxID=2690967 RepID=UPI001311BA68|nr:hypothetical protein [Natrialba sp. INN-245]MWV40062.1 hypothetical protein [Natrialba sp. INN-245]
MDEKKPITISQDTKAALEQYADDGLADTIELLIDETMTDTETDHDVPYDSYVNTLEGIDTLAYNLLEAITENDDLDQETHQTAKRHLREVRAQVDPLLLTFRCRLEDASDADPDPEPETDGGIPAITHSASGTHSILGPEPVAFEHSTHEDGGETDGE